MYCSSHVNIAFFLDYSLLKYYVSILVCFLSHSKSLAHSFTYVNALLWPVTGQCVNNLYAGKPNIHTLHWELYRVILMNLMRERVEETLRFGAQIAHFQPKPFDSSFFQHQRMLLALLARNPSSFSRKRRTPLEGNLHLQWLYLPSGEAHVWPLTTREAQWNPYHTHHLREVSAITFGSYFCKG